MSSNRIGEIGGLARGTLDLSGEVDLRPYLRAQQPAAAAGPLSDLDGGAAQGANRVGHDAHENNPGDEQRKRHAPARTEPQGGGRRDAEVDEHAAPDPDEGHRAGEQDIRASQDKRARVPLAQGDKKRKIETDRAQDSGRTR